MYRYRHVCWLKSPSFIWGFLVPLALLLLINFSIFGVLLNKIFFRKQKVSSINIGNIQYLLTLLITDVDV